MDITDKKMVKDNLKIIQDNIENAARKSRTDLNDIKLIGVTKNRSVNLIKEALDSGLEFIGENRVQEAEEKIPLLKDHYKEFHFIGHLQRNKIKKLLEMRPALIHSIDSLKTAERLNQYLEEINMNQDILVQINCSGEESKYGLDDDAETVDSFIGTLSSLSNIRVLGLMTIALFTDDETGLRNCFRRLRKHFERINTKKIYKDELNILSMGMSNDYIIAIEEGANMVRIGSAIFQ